MTLAEKIAYIKGLADGMKLDDSKDEVKLIKELIAVLEDVAYDIEEQDEIMGEMQEQLDAVDEDLDELEEFVYECDCCDDDDCDCCDDDCDCGCCDFDDDYFEVECPSCGETICIDESILDEGSIECPACHENLEFEFDDCDCEEDD